MGELILAVDDNVLLLQALRLRLEMTGYQVLTAPDGRAALDLLKTTTPNLIVADIMMPNLNGWDLYLRVRNDPRLTHVPFIFLTARADAASIQKGKALGADDFITKPFDPHELVASIQGRLRRAAQIDRLALASQDTSDVFAIGDLLLDLSAHRLSRGATEIALTPIEFKLLAYLARNAGRVCATYEIAGALYPHDAQLCAPDETLRAHIKNLRQKIESDSANPRHIVTVRSVGYRLDTKA
jgi:two-component system alkaline phosphatase synthesis response regulator PhoP